MVPVLADGAVEEIHVDRPEDNVEKDKGNDQGPGDNKDHPAIDGRPEADKPAYGS
jgi:hypothetical protein